MTKIGFDIENIRLILVLSSWLLGVPNLVPLMEKCAFHCVVFKPPRRLVRPLVQGVYYATEIRFQSNADRSILLKLKISKNC